MFNRTVSKVDDFLAQRSQGHARWSARTPSRSWSRLLKKPRRVMLMVKAGETVDEMIDSLLPHLEKGDIIIDGGNSLFTDTQSPHQRPCGEGHPVHRHRRFRRRGRRAARPFDHAGRQSRGVAAREGDLPVHRRQSRRRHALLRLGGRRTAPATT